MTRAFWLVLVVRREGHVGAYILGYIHLTYIAAASCQHRNISIGKLAEVKRGRSEVSVSTAIST